jgi:hypothetical protein
MMNGMFSFFKYFIRSNNDYLHDIQLLREEIMAQNRIEIITLESKLFDMNKKLDKIELSFKDLKCFYLD